METVTENDAMVTVNGIAASVSNRSYLAEDIPLQPGNNTITVVASDAVGNIGQTAMVVVYEPQIDKVIEVVSGQSQSGVINTPLDQPLTIRITNQGQPVANKTVVYRVIQGDGVLQPDTAEEAQGAIVTTDANGEAQASFRLGFRAGSGNHRVRAKVVGFKGEALFQASAQYSTGILIGVIAGNNQRGAIRQPLPLPFVIAVTDEGANLIPNAQIEFEVTQGGGVFQNGETTLLTTTDSDGRASAHLTLGPEQGLDQQRVSARLVGTQAQAGFTASGLVPSEAGDTRISGVVLDNQDTPLPNVTVRVEGTTRQGITDDQGQFIITDTPIGPIHLIAEGSTTTVEGEWPSLSYNIVTIPGVDNPLAAPIYMVKLDTDNAVYVGLKDTDVTHPDLPGFNLKVLKDSVTFPDGSKEGYLSITQVNSNKVPMPPPNAMQPQLIVTIQPTGAMFDPPAQLTLPNVDGHTPGAEVEMYSFDHDLEEFVTIGIGTVSKDGSTITSNVGTGVIKAGWHCGSSPGGTGCAHLCDECEDCNDNCVCEFNGEKERKQQVEGNCRTELCAGHRINDEDDPEERCLNCRDGTIIDTEGHTANYDLLIDPEFCPDRMHDEEIDHEFDGCSFAPDTLGIWNHGAPGTGISLGLILGPFLNLGNQSTRFGEVLGSVPHDAAQNQSLPCNKHDLCWQTCGFSKDECDTKLASDIEETCRSGFPADCPYTDPLECLAYSNQREACETLGSRYEQGVGLGGFAGGPLEALNFYKGNQTKYCQCCISDN